MKRLVLLLGILTFITSCNWNETNKEELKLEYSKYIEKYARNYSSINNPEHFLQKLFEGKPNVERQQKTLKLFELAFSERQNWEKLVLSIDKNSIQELLSYYYATYGDSRSYSRFQEIVLSESDPNDKLQTPNFAFRDQAGNRIELKEFFGKLVIIDFWATWCKPCLNLEDDYKRIVKKYEKDDNVKFVSIAVRQPEEKWKEHIEGNKDNYPNLLDGIFENSDFEVPKGYFDLFSIPKFAFIGKDGKTIYSNGPQPNSNYFEELIHKYK